MRSRAQSAQSLSALPAGVTSHVGGRDIHGGMLHDWSAISFVPGARMQDAVALLENFDRHQEIYPEVVQGRVLQRNGGHISASHRIHKKKVLEVNLLARYELDVLASAPNRYASRSVSSEIREVTDAGTEREKALPDGHGHGFLWRLNTFWILEQTPAGVWMECRSVSLSRQTPFGLGWAVKPMVKEVPRESLEGLMEATRKALVGQVPAKR